MTDIAELDILVESMINYIEKVEPDVHVKFNPEVYEDEQANLNVYPPLPWTDEKCLDLQEKIGERVVDTYLDTGFLILVYVYMPEQQIAEAQREQTLAEEMLKNVEQRRSEAERVLTEAKVLGLTPAGID